MIIIEILPWNQNGAAMCMCFNILTCQDEEGFVCRAYPNSVIYPLTKKQAIQISRNNPPATSVLGHLSGLFPW